jgi:TRAP-type C4-dicarboxylate transport system substrate-binding protein
MPNGPSTQLLGAFIVAVAVLAAGLPADSATLRASHQFPGGKGDVRDDMVQMIAKEVAAANVDLQVQVYPGASLFKPNDQWDALANGQLDIRFSRSTMPAARSARSARRSCPVSSAARTAPSESTHRNS